MRFPYSTRRPLYALTCLATLAGLSGCGTSDYNNLVNRRTNMLIAEAPFRSLYGATELPDTPLKIRVPMIFSRAYQENSPHPDDGPHIHADRLQPPFLPLPGFKLCYEGTINDPTNGRLPFYCYLAAVPAKPGDAEKLAADLQAELKKIFPTTPDKWEDVQIDTADGKYASWKRIGVDGEQQFYHSTQDQKDSVKLAGHFELWLFETAEYDVLVGWRAPNLVLTTPAGLAGVNPAAISNRPNMTDMPKLTAGTLSVGNAPASAPVGAG